MNKNTIKPEPLIPSELMIGNLVLDSTKTTTIVETIIPEHNRVYYGIPLTEERLLHFGFKSYPHFTVMNCKIIRLGRGRQLSIGCVGTPNEMVFLQDGDDIACLRNYDYDGKTYFHQIQNICASFGIKLSEKGGDGE